MNAKEKLRISILKILNLNNLKLFGCLIYNFQIDIIKSENKNEELTAFATIINNKPYIGLFEQFIEKCDINELIFVILHEILHILNGHTIRKGELNSHLWNLAGDHVINMTLKKDIDNNNMNQVRIPKEVYYVDQLKNKNMTTYEVYDYLKQNTTITNQYDIQYGENENDSLTVTEADIAGQKTIFVSDVKQSTQNEQSDDQKIVENLKTEMRSLVNDERIKGILSGDLKRMIMDLIEVEVPWEKLLEKALLTKILPSPDCRTWTNPMKRFRTHGWIMPGVGTKKQTSICAIVIDTSGSISDNDLQKFTSIIFQAISRFDEIWILKHDVKIHQNIRIKTSELQDTDLIFEYNGRGGTSHKYIFEEIEKSFKKKEPIDIIIMLTDFESDIEENWNKFKWTERIPICLILTENHSIPEYIDKNPIYIK